MGWVADHRGHRVPIIQFLAGASLLAYVGAFFGNSFYWTASLPLIEAVTLGCLGDRLDRYGHIRLWGSIGFVVAVIGLVCTVQYLGMMALLWVILVLLAVVWGLS